MARQAPEIRKFFARGFECARRSRVIADNKIMKTALLFATVLGAFACATPAAHAGGFYFSFGGYGCGPRYYAPPVCYAPRPVYYSCAPRVVYYQSAPVCYAPARVIYRAPIVYGGCGIGRGAYGWRR